MIDPFVAVGIEVEIGRQFVAGAGSGPAVQNRAACTERRHVCGGAAAGGGAVTVDVVPHRVQLRQLRHFDEPVAVNVAKHR